MATIDDVEQGICQTLATVLFPAQAYLAGQVSTCSSPWLGAFGAPEVLPQVRLGIGEPASSEMEQDLAAAISNVIVVRIAGSVRNCTFLRPYWVNVSAQVPTLLAELSGGSVTFGGLAGVGMVAGITAQQVCYAYRCAADDSPSKVAIAFSEMIPGASVNGQELIVPGITAAKIVADQQVFWCTGQREALVQVVIIATASSEGGVDGPLVRAALGRLVYGLEALTRPDGSLNRFIGLSDGTQAQLFGVDEIDDDAPDRDNMWKRTVTFRVVYDTGVAQTHYRVLAPIILANTNAAHVFWAGNGLPVDGILTDGYGNVLGDSAGAMLGLVS